MRAKKKWEIHTQEKSDIALLTSKLGVSEIIAGLLINRGYKDPEEARKFIDKSEAFLYNPFLMKDMDKAVSRIARAVKEKEKICVYGDYDTDGVTSVAVLLRYFKEYGIDVDYYIPSRLTEGYGLHCESFDAIKAKGADLVITADTGITAEKEAAYAASLGLDLIITDHHQCGQTLPNALAVVNPHRPDCPYPFKDLAGVGVAFKLACATELYLVNGGEYNLQTVKDMCRRYLEYVAIGTIADVMPIAGENRIIVHIGTNLMKSTDKIGIRSLLRTSGIETESNGRRGATKKLTSTNIAFSIGPRINAAGRMGDAGRALSLFMTDSPILADIISEELCETNRERQAAESEILQEAEAFIAANPALLEDPILVIGGDNWHIGVIGIVTSRLTEKYGKPSVMISFPDKGNAGRGSARSISGFNIYNAFSACSDLLGQFGGHEMAAGLSIQRDNLEAFRRRINDYAKNETDFSLLESALEIDCALKKEDINLETANSLSLLEPCGVTNEIPVFLLENAVVSDIFSLSNGKHTKLMIDRGDIKIPCLFFNRNLEAEGIAAGDSLDIVFELSVNEYNGTCSAQMTGKEYAFSRSALALMKEEDERCDAFLALKSSCAKEDVPSRDDFASVYLYLKRQVQTDSELNLKRAMLDLPAFSFAKWRIILAVLENSGLLTLQKNDILFYRFSLISCSEKKNLTENPLLTEVAKLSE